MAETAAPARAPLWRNDAAAGAPRVRVGHGELRDRHVDFLSLLTSFTSVLENEMSYFEVAEPSFTRRPAGSKPLTGEPIAH